MVNFTKCRSDNPVQCTNGHLLLSPKQTSTLKKEFIEKFQDDLAKSPDYKEILDKLDLVEKEIKMKQESLKEKEKQIDKIENKSRNKMKVLKKKNN